MYKYKYNKSINIFIKIKNNKYIKNKQQSTNITKQM